MVGINPNIISQVQSKVDQSVGQLNTEQLKEEILSGLKAQSESSSLFEAFPAGQDDYDACISYIEQVEAAELATIEEISEDIKGRVNAGQEAWEELFYGVTAVSRSRGGRQMFFLEYASQLPGGADQYGMKRIAGLVGEEKDPSSIVSTVREGMLGWAREQIPQGSHAQGYRVYPNAEVLDSEIGYDLEKNAMEVGEMEEMVREKMNVVFAALSTLSEYRAVLAKSLDPDSGDIDDAGDVDDRNQSEDQEFYGHA